MDPAIRCSVNAPASHDPEVARTELNSSTVHSLSLSLSLPLHIRAHINAHAPERRCVGGATLFFFTRSRTLSVRVFDHISTLGLCVRALSPSGGRCTPVCTHYMSTRSMYIREYGEKYVRS